MINQTFTQTPYMTPPIVNTFYIQQAYFKYLKRFPRLPNPAYVTSYHCHYYHYHHYYILRIYCKNFN